MKVDQKAQDDAAKKVTEELDKKGKILEIQKNIQAALANMLKTKEGLPEDSTFSPLEKSSASYIIEALYKQILDDPNSVTFNVVAKDKDSQEITVSAKEPVRYLSPLHVNADDKMQVDLIEVEVKDVNLATLFDRSDFRHLKLDPTLVDKYATLEKDHYQKFKKELKAKYKKFKNIVDNDPNVTQDDEDKFKKLQKQLQEELLIHNSENNLNKNIGEKVVEVQNEVDLSNEAAEKSLLSNKLASLKELESLPYGAKLALRKYTSGHYAKINNLTKGRVLDFMDTEIVKPEEQVKYAFLDAVTTQNVIANLQNPINYPTLRVERFNARGEVLKEKAQNNIINEERGLVSSADKLQSDFAAGGDEVDFIIKNPQGIDLSPISIFPSEAEILIGHSQLKFSSMIEGTDAKGVKRLALEADRVNLETGERKEKVKSTGPCDFNKHQYDIKFEKNGIVAKFNQTKMFPKNTPIELADGLMVEVPVQTEVPKNDSEIKEIIQKSPTLNLQVEDLLSRLETFMLISSEEKQASINNLEVKLMKERYINTNTDSKVDDAMDYQKLQQFKLYKSAGDEEKELIKTIKSKVFEIAHSKPNSQFKQHGVNQGDIESVSDDDRSVISQYSASENIPEYSEIEKINSPQDLLKKNPKFSEELKDIKNIFHKNKNSSFKNSSVEKSSNSNSKGKNSGQGL